MSKTQIKCRECNNKAVISSSKYITKEVTRLYCQCQNVSCGHTFRLTQSFDHTITPPAGTNEQLLLQIINDMAPEKRANLLEQFN